jgi:hypothetical protein
VGTAGRCHRDHRARYSVGTRRAAWPPWGTQAVTRPDDELAEQARATKAAARDRLEEANRRLLADAPVDAAVYGAMLVECGPWLDESSVGMIGMMQAAAQVRAGATQTTFAMVPALDRELAEACRAVVDEAASMPALPAAVWSATSTGQASAVAVEFGREADFATLTRVGIRWELLRETGTLQAELNFSGPTSICSQFLNPLPAVEALPT